MLMSNGYLYQFKPEIFGSREFKQLPIKTKRVVHQMLKESKEAIFFSLSRDNHTITAAAVYATPKNEGPFLKFSCDSFTYWLQYNRFWCIPEEFLCDPIPIINSTLLTKRIYRKKSEWERLNAERERRILNTEKRKSQKKKKSGRGTRNRLKN